MNDENNEIHQDVRKYLKKKAYLFLCVASMVFVTLTIWPIKLSLLYINRKKEKVTQSNFCLEKEAP